MAPPPSKRARVGLTEQRAWEIALAVSAPLEGRVRLVATERDLATTRAYDWIELAVPLPEHMPEPPLQCSLDWVVRARTACLVWHMLACCRGFQGHENDVFWRKLIEHVGNKRRRDGYVDYERMDIQDEDRDDDERQWWGPTPRVHGAYKFFPSWTEATAFPRFRLHVPFSLYFDAWDGYGIADDDLDIETGDDWIRSVVKTFLGLSNTFESSKVKDNAAALNPYMILDRFCKTPVEVGVHLGSTFPLEDVADTLSGVIADIETDALARKEEKHPWRLLGQSRFPLAKFRELSLCDRYTISHEDSLNELTDIIRTCNVVVPHVSLFLNAEEMGSEALYDFMLAVSRTRRKGSGRVDVLELLLDEAEEWQVEAVFSAIPITDVNTLRVCGNRNSFQERERSMNRHAWTWLAYALYHPWLAPSPIHVNLEMVDVSEPGASAMQGGLAAQRELFRLLHGEEDDTLPAEDNYKWPKGVYAIVSVREGAQCFEDASLTGDLLCEFSHNIPLTAVTKYDTFDVEELAPAVCVIVPGRGVGWVAKSHITGVKRPFADFSHISGLRLGELRANPEMKLTTLHPLVNALALLDISAWRQLAAAELFEVLKECFRVKDLSVQHNGELFHMWTEDTPGDDDWMWEHRLTSLRLAMDEDRGMLLSPSPAAWQGILQNLSELTIEAVGSRSRLLPVIRQIFQGAYPVERFVWRRGWDFHHESFASKLASYRSQLGISEGRFDVAQHALSPRARRAFASVIKRKALENDARRLRSRKSSAMGRLGPDVARLICDFASSHSSRVVWFDDFS